MDGCQGTDYRGLAAGAGGQPRFISPSGPAPPCLSPGPEGGSAAISALGLERALASSGEAARLPSRQFSEPCSTAHSPRRFYPSPHAREWPGHCPQDQPHFLLPVSPCVELPHSCPRRRRCRCAGAQATEEASARGFVANGATARLATGPLQHPSEESDCPQAIKMQFAERKPLRPHAPNCSVQAALESPPPQESRQPPLAGKSIFYRNHNGPLAFNQVLGVGNSLPVGQTLRRK
ncbi:uncharacterized protein LOC121340655 [Onychostruthus taczanowskii]|uniref:uncharacterized protein LOC121340655 n=1 Tax=Onychostruthus taczanowskii TaxID=356909 RepID=UPI001B80D685|nr:uncharacterized protein LOC121340655 [Onychostruthus taczanowskii]